MISVPHNAIKPLGDSAVTIDLGRVMDPRLNSEALAIADSLRKRPFPGFLESYVGISSVTCLYDPVIVAKEFPDSLSPFDTIVDIISETVITEPEIDSPVSIHIVKFRVGGEVSPDLDNVASVSGMSQDDVLDIFTGREYRVYMLGFLPGFAYLGEVDERIEMPRHATPRGLVRAGSVAIAGRQAGIYPVDSSGGWQLIGRTDLRPFDRDREPQILMRPGDRVKFEIV